MITAFVLLMIFGGVLGIGFQLTGALISAVLWLVLRVPFALVCWVLGAALCCTILLIPVGIRLMGLGTRLFLPV